MSHVSSYYRAVFIAGILVAIYFRDGLFFIDDHDLSYYHFDRGTCFLIGYAFAMYKLFNADSAHSCPKCGLELVDWES